MKLLKNLTLVASLGALVSGMAIAEAGKPVITNPDPVCSVPFTGSVSVGYETSYIFRGVNYGDDAPWAGVDLNGQIAGLDVNVGIWYINPTDNATINDELDLYAFVSLPDVGPFEVTAGGTWYAYLEDGTDVGELELDLAYSVGDLLDLAFISVYDLETEGWYFEAAGGKTIALGACLDLVLGAGIGYGDDYYGVSSFNHAYATAGLDFSLTETTTLTLYVGGNFPLEDLEDSGAEEETHGGASISVSF